MFVFFSSNFLSRLIVWVSILYNLHLFAFSVFIDICSINFQSFSASSLPLAALQQLPTGSPPSPSLLGQRSFLIIPTIINHHLQALKPKLCRGTLTSKTHQPSLTLLTQFLVKKKREIHLVNRRVWVKISRLQDLNWCLQDLAGPLHVH